MDGRKFVVDDYRYGMNGQEKDLEIAEGIYTAEFWEYDSRITRRWNTDPIVKPNQSPYETFDSSPIWIRDIHGNTGENGTAPEEGDAEAGPEEQGDVGNQTTNNLGAPVRTDFTGAKCHTAEPGAVPKNFQMTIDATTRRQYYFVPNDANVPDGPGWYGYVESKLTDPNYAPNKPTNVPDNNPSNLATVTTSLTAPFIVSQYLEPAPGGGGAGQVYDAPTGTADGNMAIPLSTSIINDVIAASPPGAVRNFNINVKFNPSAMQNMAGLNYQANVITALTGVAGLNTVSNGGSYPVANAAILSPPAVAAGVLPNFVATITYDQTVNMPFVWVEQEY